MTKGRVREINTLTQYCLVAIIALNILIRFVGSSVLSEIYPIMGPVGIYVWWNSMGVGRHLGIYTLLFMVIALVLFIIIGYLIVLWLRIKSKVWDWQFLLLTVFLLLSLIL
jgi:hypothetical protein